jgi:acyl-CoA thioesterase-1
MAHRLFCFAIPLLASVALLAGCAEKPATPAPEAEKAGKENAPGVPGQPSPRVDGGPTPQTTVVRYLALGDSISQGIGAPDIETGAFPSRLASRWRTNGCTVEAKNVAISGYKTEDVISSELPEVASFAPTFITLQIGANDIANSVPVETYRTNLQTILDTAKASGARVVVLTQNAWPRSPEGPSYGTELEEKRAAFDAVLIEETRAKGAELVDLRPLYEQHAASNMWADDGLHPTAEAYDAMAAEIARVIPLPCRK